MLWLWKWSYVHTACKIRASWEWIWKQLFISYKFPPSFPAIQITWNLCLLLSHLLVSWPTKKQKTCLSIISHLKQSSSIHICYNFLLLMDVLLSSYNYMLKNNMRFWIFLLKILILSLKIKSRGGSRGMTAP